MSSPTVAPPFGITLPPRGYDTLFDALVASVPAGTFYDLKFQRPIVMWTANPTNFIFETANYGVPIQVTVTRLGDYQQNVDQSNLVTSAFFTPYNPTTSFSVTLGLGTNQLVAVEQIPGGRTAVFEVVATPNTVIFEPYGKVIYSGAQAQIDNQYNAIYSSYATRLLDQVIQFQDLLPDFQALKIISTKLLVRGMVHFPATELGIRNVIESFCLNTPIYKDQRAGTPYEVERTTIYRAIEQRAGAEAHVWFPNLAVSRWLAFTKMAASFKNLYQLQEVTDVLVRLIYKSQEQLHEFDFNAAGSNFLSLSLTDCFNDIDVSMTSSFNLNHLICCWSYMFDEFVTPLAPIGRARVTLDTSVPFDSNLPFDGDPVDPYSDGWVGWSLSGRFEQDAASSQQAQYALDTHVSPSLSYTGSPCVYQGPWTQMFNSIRTDIDIYEDITYDPANTNWGGYVGGPVVGLALQIPEGPFFAGTPVLAVATFVDSNDMTNMSGSGNFHIQESSGGAAEDIPVVAGYAYFNLTPTKAGGSITWALSSGALSGTSPARQVLAGPFGGFIISAIGPQQVGVPFTVSVQATDQYGNFVTDVGTNNKVAIDATGGLTPGTVSPNYVDLTGGVGSTQVTLSANGTGVLSFTLGAVSQASNIFTVT